MKYCYHQILNQYYFSFHIHDIHDVHVDTEYGVAMDKAGDEENVVHDESMDHDENVDHDGNVDHVGKVDHDENVDQGRKVDQFRDVLGTDDDD